MTLLIDFLGCKVNSYEVEAIAETFIQNGFSFFDAKKDEFPDVIIINTCAVTQTSVTKDKKVIKKYRKLYPNAILVVMGCYAQFDYEKISKEMGANIVLGTSNRNKIYELVMKYFKNKENICLHDENNSITKYEKLKLAHSYLTTRAYVKIQDGCNNFCSYCLIPYIRGRSRSRDASDIVEEIQNLVKNGYKEVVLTGIDMSSYGLDLPEKISFSNLIEKILVEVPNLYRLRISSLEESQIDEKFINLLGKYDNFASHLHIPLQSGSASILKKMNRKYDLSGFYTKIFALRKIKPGLSITTDVIVGFPGETEENFMETYNFCKEIKFTKIHVFPYSSRQGTVASKMPNQIDPKIKKDRVNRLLELSKEFENEYINNYLGKEIEFLFEDYLEKEHAYRGHSSNYLECIYKSEEELTNKVKKVKLTEDNFKYF